jgi:transposase
METEGNTINLNKPAVMESRQGSLHTADPDSGLGPRTIGLDVHRDSIYVTLFCPHEGTLEQFEVSTRNEAQVRAFEAKLRVTDRVALEATGNSIYWYRRLAPRVAEVVLANPIKLKLYRSQQAKTDRIDSSWLAVLLAFGCLPTVWVPDEETEEDRELLGRRVQLVRTETREKNRIRALLIKQNLTCPHSDVGAPDARQFLRKAIKELPFSPRETLESHLRQLESLQAEIRRIEHLIHSRAMRRPEMALLLTIPGLELLTAMTILVAIGNIKRFASPRALANYSGLVPRVRASANRSHHGRVTRYGSKSLRWALNIAVTSLVKRPGRCQDFYNKILSKKGPGTAMAACARKLLVAIWHMLNTGECFRERNEDLEIRKRARVERKIEASKVALAARAQESLATEHLALLMDLARARAPRGGQPLRLRYLKLDAAKVLAPSHR